MGNGWRWSVHKIMPDLERYNALSQEQHCESREISPLVTDVLGNGLRKRIDFMASHMFSQLKEHEAAQERTTQMFQKLLCQLEEVVATFQHSFYERDLPLGMSMPRLTRIVLLGFCSVMARR